MSPYRSRPEGAQETRGPADHAHTLFELSKTRTMVPVVEAVRKSSSIWTRIHGPWQRDLRRRAGYGAFSVGASDERHLMGLTGCRRVSCAPSGRCMFEGMHPGRRRALPGLPRAIVLPPFRRRGNAGPRERGTNGRRVHETPAPFAVPRSRDSPCRLKGGTTNTPRLAVPRSRGFRLPPEGRNYEHTPLGGSAFTRLPPAA